MIGEWLRRAERKSSKVFSSFPQECDAGAFYGAMQERIKELGSPDCLKKFRYEGGERRITDCNFFVAVLADEIARKSGMRVAMPYDEDRSPLSEMIGGGYRVVYPCLDVRKIELTRPYNAMILGRVVQLVREKEEKEEISFPFRVSGLELVAEEGGYGINVAPIGGDLSKFEILHDDRLSYFCGNGRFNKVDKKGLPIFVCEGRRSWFAKGDGIAGVGIGRDGDLHSEWSDLNVFYSDCQVIVLPND
ncbi:MAG: hypothetical protein V1889_02245 [archaeon]